MSPNERCPCGSGKKLKKCCQYKVVKPTPQEQQDEADRKAKEAKDNRIIAMSALGLLEAVASLGIHEDVPFDRPLYRRRGLK